MNGLKWRTISTDKEVEGNEYNEGELVDGRGLVRMGIAIRRNNGNTRSIRSNTALSGYESPSNHEAFYKFTMTPTQASFPFKINLNRVLQTYFPSYRPEEAQPQGW